MSEPSRRAVYCPCGWTGRRVSHANNAPCPRCTGPVYVSGRSVGRPRSEAVRVRVTLPRRWAELLMPDVSPKIRELVGEHLAAQGYDLE